MYYGVFISGTKFTRVLNCVIAYCHVFYNASWCSHKSHKVIKGMSLVMIFCYMLFNVLHIFKIVTMCALVLNLGRNFCHVFLNSYRYSHLSYIVEPALVKRKRKKSSSSEISPRHIIESHTPKTNKI